MQTCVFVYEVSTKVSRFHYKTVLISLRCDLLEISYLCGRINNRKTNNNNNKNNYPHNVHFAVIPCKGKSAVWNFEEWHVEIENGIISPIPSQEMLDEKFFRKPYDEHFYTCRIFRWMVGFYYPKMLYKNKD